METITQAVGIRNGQTMMPNNQADLQTVTGLLDRIPLTNGGTADTPGLWSSDQTLLIGQVTAAITAFQVANNRPVFDGVVDPGGGTLQKMNQLAGPGPVTATVVRPETNSQVWVVAEQSSLDGTGPLRPLQIAPQITRRLVSVNGMLIKWFGVVVPLTASGEIAGGAPHIFFAPAAWQHHPPCQDGDYDNFTNIATWIDLWDKYTSIIGSQLVFSGKPQILVIPFYKDPQRIDLGSFLTNWREVVSAVITAAVISIDPLFLRDKFEFDQIFSSCFSNGAVTLANFDTSGAGVASTTRFTFVLDGIPDWRPTRGAIYRSDAPQGTNPVGFVWNVGGRFAQISPSYPKTADHNLCPFLLLHGLSNFG